MKRLEQLLSLEGKTCVLTGAANGIGKGIATRFAEAGASLILVDIDKDQLLKTQATLQGDADRFKIFILDLSAKENIDRFWAELRNEKVDILVNNAGIFPFMDFLKLTEHELMQVMHVNLFSTVWMCQAFIRKNIRSGGIIVNFGSIESILPFKKDLTHYSLSKMGVLALTRDLAKEYAGKDFRVNAIIPGCILTRGTKDAAIKAIRTMDLKLLSDGYNFKQRVPAGKLGKPDDVAKLVLALCSDVGSFIHGAIIPVDGGFLCA